MKINNLKTFILGNGKLSKGFYMSLDLIPIQIVFKYDLEKVKYKLYGQKCTHEKIPDFINKIHTVDIFQKIIDLICKELTLEKRDLICFKEELPKFDPIKSDVFYEFQFNSEYGRKYYTPTKIHNALKFYDQLKHFYTSSKGKRETPHNFHYPFWEIFEDIERQKVFTKRDYIEISKKTLDN
ncbi:MAG: hypothetical protein ACWA5P_02060, partial [bacterium]